MCTRARAADGRARASSSPKIFPAPAARHSPAASAPAPPLAPRSSNVKRLQFFFDFFCLCEWNGGLTRHAGDPARTQRPRSHQPPARRRDRLRRLAMRRVTCPHLRACSRPRRVRGAAGLGTNYNALAPTSAMTKQPSTLTAATSPHSQCSTPRPTTTLSPAPRLSHPRTSPSSARFRNRAMWRQARKSCRLAPRPAPGTPRSTTASTFSCCRPNTGAQLSKAPTLSHRFR